MRNKILLLIALLLSVFAVTPGYGVGVASDCKEEKLNRGDWTIFQIGFWLDFPSSTANSNVYGIKTGQPMSSGIGRVHGTEISWFTSATDNIKGLQVCWCTCFSEYLQGVQASLGFNLTKKELEGFQAGPVNISGNFYGFQAGAVNLGENISGFQAAPLLNCAGTIDGVQMGLVNLAKTFNGFQASAVNLAEENSNGFQLGFFNMSKGKGVQIGILNYTKGALIPWFPLFNLKF